jgi:hypothetical protein
VTITEARPENVSILKARFPEQRVISVDLEVPRALPESPFEIVHCYGLLYHLREPEPLLQFISANCSGMLFLETCVSFGDELAVNVVDEYQANPTQSFSGSGCRPTRPWIFKKLRELFPHVYLPITQPNHEEFPLDWTDPAAHRSPMGLQRSVFIASALPVTNQWLAPHIPMHQTRAA